MNRTWKKWAPAVAVTAAVGAGALVVPLTANAAVDLPDLSAADVLELAAGHSVTELSGTIEQTSDLGLPDLSALGGSTPGLDATGGTDPGTTPGAATPDAAAGDSPAATPESTMLELLTAPHTFRVFVDGPSQARVQVLDEMAERNLILNGEDFWFYDSAENAAVHSTLEDHGEVPGDVPDVPTPEKLAALFLEKADESTEVSVGPDRTVAGRAAYQLILTPDAEETLVESITIDVDGETGFPLAVSVGAVDGDIPAFSAVYTDITFEAPEAETFEFTPPSGATVTELPDHAGTDPTGDTSRGKESSESGAAEDRPEPTVTGTGWESVVEFDAEDLTSGASAADNAVPTDLLEQLGTPVDGGSLLQTRLVNILVTDDGRVLVGSVPAARLQAVASGE